jgi:hypothetical protein
MSLKKKAAQAHSRNGQKAEPTKVPAGGCQERNGHNEQKPLPRVERYTIGRLQEQYPNLNPPIIDGLARSGETINVISASKIGKSWLIYNLLLSVVTGRYWLGRFKTTRGRVLLIDNELHKSTLAFRLKTVADAMGIPTDQYADDIDIWPIRGMGRSLASLLPEFNGLDGQYVLVVIDAKYRAIEPGASENDNAAETAFYNTADQVAAKMGAALLFVHHSTKGSQTEKRVTDVEAGAGAQSRAADCHVVLREHKEEDAVVLEAAVRSFKPVEPTVLRWKFPLWEADVTADPTMLKGKKTAGDEKQSKADDEADETVLRLAKGPQSRQQLKKSTGFGYTRLDRCIRRLLDAERVTAGTEQKNGKEITVYQNVGDE